MSSAARAMAPTAREHRRSARSFPLVLELVHGIVTVDDAILLRTLFYLWERRKLVVEPTGALGAAAALGGATSIRGARAGVTLSGGNVDMTQVAAWLETQ